MREIDWKEEGRKLREGGEVIVTEEEIHDHINYLLEHKLGECYALCLEMYLKQIGAPEEDWREIVDGVARLVRGKE